MAILKINTLGEIGLNTDLPSTLVGPNTWTDCRNVDFIDGQVIRSKGYASAVALGTPSATPYFAFQAKDGVQSNDYVIYAGLNRVYALIGDNNTHVNITRTAMDADLIYSASVNNSWQAGVINGILILNNGTDAPQKWTQALSTQRMSDLDDWSSTWKATVVRPFRNFLVAVDVTKDGNRFPQMVKWSTSASAGNVPLSWDIADATNDAGEFEIAETPDHCIDALSLQNTMIIYKETTTWGMTYIGFPFIFRFFKIFDELGAIAKNCVVEVNDRHIVLTQKDIIIHNGQNFESLVNKKVRKHIFNNLDRSSQKNCFVFYDSFNAQVLFGIPVNATYPDRLYVFNLDDNTWGIRDIASTNHITKDFGVSAAKIWDDDSEVWDDDESPWNEGGLIAGGLVGVSAVLNKLFKHNFGTTADGLPITAYVEKSGIGWSVSLENDDLNVKLFRSLRPEISASSSVGMNIYVGSQFNLTDTIDFTGPFIFNPLVDQDIYFHRIGRYFTVKFETIGGPIWELKHMLVDIEPVGQHMKVIP